MMKVNINRVSISTKIQKAKDIAEERTKDELELMAMDLVKWSPVLSGAYVGSHSILPSGSNGGRLRKSDPDRGVNKEAARGEALSQLIGDIAALDFETTSGAIFRNRAVHAVDVETGSNWKRTAGYYPYTKLAGKYG